MVCDLDKKDVEALRLVSDALVRIRELARNSDILI